MASGKAEHPSILLQTTVVKKHPEAFYLQNQITYRTGWAHHQQIPGMPAHSSAACASFKKIFF